MSLPDLFIKYSLKIKLAGFQLNKRKNYSNYYTTTKEKLKAVIKRFNAHIISNVRIFFVYAHFFREFLSENRTFT